MSNIPETYLYEVRPVGRPIILGHGVEIKSRKSLYLTKDDVFKCLGSAYVYRRFALREPERVTITNVDRLHRQVYIPENEWANYNKSEENIKQNTVAEEKLTEEVTEPKSEEVERQEEVETEAADDIVSVENDEIAGDETITEEAIDVAELVDEENNESGDLVSESPNQPSHPKQGTYTYNKKHKKH